VIRKGKAAKPTEFGKLVKLQEAENQIVIDYEVYAKRPNDSDLLIPAIEMHATMLGRVPHLLAADAGFYSDKNEALVSQRPAMAHRVRRSHQREQASTWPQPVRISRRRWNEALGGARGHRRQSH
jgi:IS5 family transposase